MVRLPGFGLPLDSMPKWERKGAQERFPHAIADFFVTEGITLREQKMLDFINQITDKPRWQEKIYNDEIVSKWQAEACGSEHDQETSPVHLSLSCFQFCLQELKDKAAYQRKYGVVHVLDVEATIVKVDTDDNSTLCPLLIEAVKPLENVHDSRKDWHPGSDGLVLDLVHPSLFPLQYGKSFVLPTGEVGFTNCEKYVCRGVVCEERDDLSDSLNYTRRLSWSNKTTLQPWGNYQWLPSDIRFRPDGTAQIASYINNLHPVQHIELYSVLEKAVDSVIPMLNESISFYHTRLRVREPSVGIFNFKFPASLAENDVSEHAEDEERGASADSDEQDDEDNEDDDEDDDEEMDEEDRRRQWLRDNPDRRKIIQPGPTEHFIPFETKAGKEGQRRRDLRTEFSDGIQIIFKLANIELTPDKPHYRGSEWHVEGALNEHICATALIYYDQDNIEDTYLEFRHQVDAEAMIMKPGQDEWEAAEDMYGIEQEGPAIQDLGKVLTRKGRMLTFPNVMQHRIQPFGLADPNKPGHRKILAMFLVDPNIRILSTSNVPPQQRDWWALEVRLIRPFAELPVELFDRIMQHVEHFPISWDEACEVREALMAERGLAREEFDRALTGDTFFFCEH